MEAVRGPAEQSSHSVAACHVHPPLIVPIQPAAYPQIFDVLAAATYLAQALEPTIAIIVFITVGSYIPLTVRGHEAACLRITHITLGLPARV